MITLDILIGTANLGKVTEIKRALNGLPLNLRVITDFPTINSPDECGDTYAANAIIKAQSYSEQTGLWTLADDSGLEVTSLNGLPGVKSARFGGDGLSDADRTNLLLSKLSTVDDNHRSARFVCSMVIATQSGEVINVAHGTCEGSIAKAPSGAEGFGYDPVFIPAGYQTTFAEMPLSLKNTLSHRGKALAATREFLEQLFSRA
ncbi:MAG: RdgB/HAM1 family non-canonical purine NTP pyrophosphatase [Pyrinomonadaceae bacterium]|nr:RdgB/HAM1 family non-canonical purine NTP pyrophosphatase [Pyrinomonadaceae bacterium]